MPVAVAAAGDAAGPAAVTAAGAAAGRVTAGAGSGVLAGGATRRSKPPRRMRMGDEADDEGWHDDEIKMVSADMLR